MNFFATSDHDSAREARRAAFSSLLLELTGEELEELERQIRLRLWRGRCLSLRRLPAAIKLGLVYSSLAFVAIVLIPLPAGPPLFVPLLIAATGCVAVTLVAVLDLALGITLVRLKPQVPAFDSLEAATDPGDQGLSESVSLAQGN